MLLSAPTHTILLMASLSRCTWALLLASFFFLLLFETAAIFDLSCHIYFNLQLYRQQPPFLISIFIICCLMLRLSLPSSVFVEYSLWLHSVGELRKSKIWMPEDWSCQKMAMNGENMAKSSSEILGNSEVTSSAKGAIVVQRRELSGRRRTPVLFE